MVGDEAGRYLNVECKQRWFSKDFVATGLNIEYIEEERWGWEGEARERKWWGWW